MGLSAHKPNIIQPHNHIFVYPNQKQLSQQQKQIAMELPAALPPSWRRLYPSPLLFPYQIIPENYVHWNETPESHIFSVDLPGVREEEIKVEVEDSRYLIIRTEAIDESSEPAKSFMRKFRLPGMVDIGGISAGYQNGVLTVTVPRSFRRREFHIDPADAPARVEIAARAA